MKKIFPLLVIFLSINASAQKYGLYLNYDPGLSIVSGTYDGFQVTGLASNTFGLGFYMKPIERMRINSGVYYQIAGFKYTAVGTFTNSQGTSTIPYSSEIDLKFQSLYLPLVVNYEFTKTKLRPYIGAGLFVSGLISQTSNILFNVNTNSLTYGWIGTAGLNYSFGLRSFVGFAVNYKASLNPLTTDENSNIKLNSFSLGLSLGTKF